MAKDRRDSISIPRLLRLLWVIPLAVAFFSAMLYLIQGGFGAGHGDLDLLLWVLALPWSLIEWPGIFYWRDYLWLIVVPFVCNGILLFIPIILSKRQNKQAGENS